jgi:hypothetical protein
MFQQLGGIIVLGDGQGVVILDRVALREGYSKQVIFKQEPEGGKR